MTHRSTLLLFEPRKTPRLLLMALFVVTTTSLSLLQQILLQSPLRPAARVLKGPRDTGEAPADQIRIHQGPETGSGPEELSMRRSPAQPGQETSPAPAALEAGTPYWGLQAGNVESRRNEMHRGGVPRSFLLGIYKYISRRDEQDASFCISISFYPPSNRFTKNSEKRTFPPKFVCDAQVRRKNSKISQGFLAALLPEGCRDKK